MPLTREQIIQNITAMESQGAPPDDIQAYVSSVGGSVQAPQSPQAATAPNIFNAQAAGDVFKQAGQDINTAQGGFDKFGTAVLQGGLAPFRSVLAGFGGSHQGQAVTGSIVNALTSFGDVITPDSVQNYIGDKALEIIGGYQYMSPQDQLKQRNRLALAEILSYAVGGPSAKNAVVGPVARGAEAITETTGNIAGRAGETLGGPLKALDVRPTPKPNQAIDTVASAFQKAFVDDNSATNKAFAKLAAQQSRPDAPVTTSSLLRDLTIEGVFPKVSGRLADFTESVGRLSDRQSRIGNDIDAILAPRTESTNLSSLRAETEAILANSPQIDVTLETALNQVGRFFDGIEKKTKTAQGFKPNELNPTQLNQVRKNMNAQTRSFKQAEFHQDVADAVADAVRKRLDVLEPKVRAFNVDWARLQGVKKTASVLQFKPINVGVFGSQLGRLAAATALGASGAATGSGSLVIAGIVAHFGGEAFANLLRKRVLSPKSQKVIIDAIKKNPNFARELVNDAKGSDKALLAKTLLDPNAEPEFLALPSGSIPLEAPQGSGRNVARVVDAEKGPVGVEPKTGKFQKTFTGQSKQ